MNECCDRQSISASLDHAIISTPIGGLTLCADAEALLAIGFAPDNAESIQPQTLLLKNACIQVLSYFDDPHRTFDIPLRLNGSSYALRVWAALRAIPVGSVQSYGQLAAQLNTGARALANACKANEFPIIIPCHRVVSSSGIGGYCGHASGHFIEIKRWLLRHEGYERF